MNNGNDKAQIDTIVRMVREQLETGLSEKLKNAKTTLGLSSTPNADFATIVIVHPFAFIVAQMIYQFAQVAMGCQDDVPAFTPHEVKLDTKQERSLN